MRAKIYSADIYGIVLCLLTFVLTMIIPRFISVSGVVVLLIISVITLVIYGLFLSKTKSDTSWILLYPIILSAFQNIFIGFSSKNLDPLNTQILLSINYFFTLEILILWLITSKQEKVCKWFLGVLLVVIAYSVLLIPFQVPSVASFIACFRNISSPIIFFIFGYSFKDRINKDRFIKITMVVFLIVALFGFVELYIYKDFWINNNIKELWENKGFSVMDWGLPANFYSSEIIGGSQLRRMVSSFADPVNLGTFLFCGLMIAWFAKRKLMVLILGISCILTVSKGALLGIIIFVVIYAWYMPKSRAPFFIALAFAGAGVIAFLVYSSLHSTGSVFAHIDGFVNSFSSVFTNPFGYGVGNVGVLATYLGTSANTAVMETGIGAVIAQLGVLGLIIYVCVFIKFLTISNRNRDKRESVLLVTLIFSILANIMFNEVALSPNSSALYFIIIGLYSVKKQEEPVYDKHLSFVRG